MIQVLGPRGIFPNQCRGACLGFKILGSFDLPLWDFELYGVWGLGFFTFRWLA